MGRPTSAVLSESYDDKDFFDVTLACDEEQINAHKVILSACSPFFRNVLKRNSHQNPLLYMKGVRFQDLVSVLNFMYHGEVNVAQEDLNNFLAVAEDLRVKGLTQNQAGGSGGSSSSSSRQNVKPQPEPYKPKSEVKRSVIPSRPSASSAVVQDDDDIQEVVPVKTEPAPSQVDYQDPNHSQNQQLQQLKATCSMKKDTTTMDSTTTRPSLKEPQDMMLPKVTFQSLKILINIFYP